MIPTSIYLLKLFTLKLYNAKIYLETGELFAWTTVIIILSFLFEKLLTSALKKAGDIRHG